MQKGKDLTLRLMIVDDSVESAETIVTALRNGGIAVRPSRPQSQEELASMLSGQIDLAILGQAQQIPMSALQTQIAGSGKDIPIILLAERIEENTWSRPLRTGYAPLHCATALRICLHWCARNGTTCRHAVACAASRHRCARPSGAATP